MRCKCRFALVTCGVGETSDVSTLYELCESWVMFVTADGMSCTGGCPNGEVVIPGPPGSNAIVGIARRECLTT